jgi:hypothetical protein
VLIKYTWYGDADLNGMVNTSDSGLLNARSRWINGDFDYSASVTTNDYFLIDNAFLGQGGLVLAGSTSTLLSSTTAAPEPTLLCLPGPMAGGSAGRRWRSLNGR